MSEDRPTFVARESDLETLRTTWAAARDGTAQVLRLAAPFGGGRRALSAEFLRSIDADAIVWRVTCLDHENGLQWLVRMYGSLIATLTRDTLRRGKVEMVLNAQLPSQPARVQGWYQQFIASVKEAKTDKPTAVRSSCACPRTTRSWGWSRSPPAISRKIPLVIELQNPYAVNSLALGMFVRGAARSRRAAGGKLLQILFDEPVSEITENMFPMPLLDSTSGAPSRHRSTRSRRGASRRSRPTCSRRGPRPIAARIAEIAGGRPGFVAELIDILSERELLAGDLSEVTPSSLARAPEAVDEGELERARGAPRGGRAQARGPRRHRPGHVPRGAARRGLPLEPRRRHGRLRSRLVDDLLDAMGDLFEEVPVQQRARHLDLPLQARLVPRGRHASATTRRGRPRARAPRRPVHGALPGAPRLRLHRQDRPDLRRARRPGPRRRSCGPWP